LTQTAASTGMSPAISSALGLAGKVFRETKCEQLLRQLRLHGDFGFPRGLLTPETVVRSRSPFNKVRRQFFREILKRL